MLMAAATHMGGYAHSSSSILPQLAPTTTTCRLQQVLYGLDLGTLSRTPGT
jgi:hypothetical protein